MRRDEMLPALYAERLGRLREQIEAVSQAASKAAAKDGVKRLHGEVRSWRRHLPPLAAAMLARVERDAQAASGAVLDKSRRLAELQDSWEQLLRLLGGL